MTKQVKEFLLDHVSGNVDVEYSDNSTSSYNLANAVTAAESFQGVRFPVTGLPDCALSMILPASILAAQSVVTGVTTEQVLHSFLVPKECHGGTTRLLFAMLASMTNNANAKTFRIRIGASLAASIVIAQSSPTGVATLSVPRIVLRNRGTKLSQVCSYSLSLNAGTSGTPPQYFTIDLSADQNIYVTVQLSNAGDTVLLEDFEMEFGG